MSTGNGELSARKPFARGTDEFGLVSLIAVSADCLALTLTLALAPEVEAEAELAEAQLALGSL